MAHAESYGKAHSVVDLDKAEALSRMREFLCARPADAVCIAGPRESEAPGIYAKAREVLSRSLVAVSNPERRRAHRV